ncbi:MAG: PQQ-binding-like beta-propeller repeat protein [Pirellulales bacterium]
MSWPRLAAAAVALVVASADAGGYQLPHNGLGLNVPFEAAAPVTLSTPQVPLVSASTAARLEQVPKIAAEGNWDDAIDTLRDLAGQEADRVVALDKSRYINLPNYCQLQIAGWPKEGLDRYRQRVDSQAEASYRAGLADRDEAKLGRIVDELFCSSWGDDALLALGELALERADYAAARRYWQQIGPPAGDAAAQQAWLIYPDSPIDVAEVRARLVLVSIRAGQLDRATLELSDFRRMHPQAVGRLAGQTGALTAALERLLAAARAWPASPLKNDWPTFAGSPGRDAVAPPLGPLAGSAWREPVRLPSAKSLSHYPIASAKRIYYADETRVYAAQLADGRPAITPDGVIYQEDTLFQPDLLAMLGNELGIGSPRNTLTLGGDVLYARVGQPATARLRPAESRSVDRLVGLDLSRDGLLAFRARPDSDQWSFDGVPLSDGRNLYVATRRSDVNPHAAVACFDAASGRQLWRTAVGSADTLAAGRSDEVTHNLLTLVGDRIFFNSNLGVVAALRTSDGAICWLHRYDRRKEPVAATAGKLPALFGRDPSPALFHDGLLLAAPSDTPSVFALDAETGSRLWSNDKITDGLHLLGVVDGILAIGGARLWGVDLHSGRVRYAWPENNMADIRGLGRGVIAGREVFWPTRKEIHVLDAATGAPTRKPLDITALGGDGANLIVAEGYLIAAGNNRMMAYGQSHGRAPEKE